MFIDNLDQEELQEFCRLIRGKSYTDISGMFNPQEYDTDNYILHGKEVISKDRFRKVIMNLMRIANK